MVEGTWELTIAVIIANPPFAGDAFSKIFVEYLWNKQMNEWIKENQELNLRRHHPSLTLSLISLLDHKNPKHKWFVLLKQ